MRLSILILTIIALTGIAFAWPMENGTVQLSKINISDFPTFFPEDGWTNDLAAVGPTANMLKFAADVKGEGAPYGNKTPLRCGSA